MLRSTTRWPPWLHGLADPERLAFALYSRRAVFVAAGRARARRRRARSRSWRRGCANAGPGPQILHTDARRRAGAAIDARRGLAPAGRSRSGRRRARPPARYVPRNGASGPAVDLVAAARPAGVRARRSIARDRAARPCAETSRT